ncbi:MAG TPA: hypothetical protein VMO00_17270 [Methylomirabilota bacterium]|jgi:hypothetical protein|nr:hypothetical protein [Methylomirabilota bacterium]
MAETVHYQNSLRAIGQSLESLEVESFELDTSDDHYVVSGECKKTKATPTPEPPSTKSILGFIRNVGKKKPAQTTGPQTSHFSGLSFSEADIVLSDQKSQLLRAKFDDCTLNPHSISQVLRTVGADLDHRRNRLIKLSWCHQTLTLWHVNGLGVEAKEVFMPADLYNLWVHQFKKRLNPTGTD